VCANSPVRANARRCKASHTCDVNPVQAQLGRTQVVEGASGTRRDSEGQLEKELSDGSNLHPLREGTFWELLDLSEASENLVRVTAINEPN
jgi:hypothetical protein